MIGGLQIIFSTNALEDTEERLFPVSKHRSKRIHKKLVKRFGGEFRKKPCMWRMGDTIYAHPAFKAALNAQTKDLGAASYLTAPYLQ